MQIDSESSNPESELLREKNKHLETENTRLRNIIRQLKKDKFGSKSERYVDNSEQLVFNEIEDENQKAPTPEEKFEVIPSYTRRKSGRGKRINFPDNLVQEEVVIDLPEEDKVCPHDGTRLEEIGEEITRKLKTVPAQISVVVEKKKKYACPCCHKHMAQAKSNSILPKTISTPELLSFLIFSKFFQGLPLYRIEEYFKLHDVFLSRSLMASWLIRVAEKLQPLWNILEEKAMNSGYMAIDATKIQVLKEPGRRPQTKSFMWARGSPELGIVLFDYDPSGGGAVAKKLVTGFKGALQADAHRGYSALDRAHITLLGCMMHCRRRFYKAWLEVKKSQGLADVGLKMIRQIYKFEESYKKQELSAEARNKARLEEVSPYFEKMHQWATAMRGKVLKSSTIGNAIHYFLNEYDELTAFLKNGRYEIDNGFIERMIRKFAIGRNGWLFADSVAGAKASAILYSLVITAKANDKDPFKVMTQILKELPTAETIDDFEKLANLLLK